MIAKPQLTAAAMIQCFHAMTRVSREPWLEMINNSSKAIHRVEPSTHRARQSMHISSERLSEFGTI
jgi:hypothetical protein